MKKIGILGGTFNPVHNGHIFVAQKALEQFNLDKILFIPNGNPPHKKEVSASIEDRLSMLKLALETKKDFSIDDCEIRQDKHSYTFETLRYLKQKYPSDQLFFIAGADNLKEISNWREPDQIFSLAEMIFFVRPPYRIDPVELAKLQEHYHASVSLFELEGIEISATKIRQRIAEGKPVTGMLPSKVEQFINDKRLYIPEYGKYISQLKEILCPKRFCHTIGVAKMAEQMAKQYGMDEKKAYLAGLLHDCAKNLPQQELRKIIKRSSFPIYEGELDNPQLLHSIAGSVVAKEVFHIEDEDILSAIRYHTIGRVGMTDLEKVIYLADLVEENRNFPLVEEMRKLAFKSLDKALLLSIDNNIDYLKQRGLPVLKETYRIKESLTS